MVDFEDVGRAARFLTGRVKNTPAVRSRTFSELAEADLYLKLENLQTTGSFKVRGALNRINRLSPEERARGVVCASAGNHAQGVAFAAAALGVPSTVYIPVFAPPSKIQATRGYGADVVLEGVTYDEAFQAARARAESDGLTFVHAFDDPDIIAGQGTIGVELHEAMDRLDSVVVPIGGGGLIAGIAVALRGLRSDLEIIGVEAEGAPAMRQSLQDGRVAPLTSMDTICDGIAVKRAGELTFPLVRDLVDRVVTVDDEQVARAVFLLAQRAKLVAEPSGAAALAAVLGGRLDVRGSTVVTVVSGGNIDLALLTQIVERGLLRSGLRARIVVDVLDRPGALDDLLDAFTSERANIQTVEHDRQATDVSVGRVRITVTFRTLGPEHTASLCSALVSRGYNATVLD